MPESKKPLHLFTLTTLAMLAFAGNSLLGRAALLETQVDPLSFVFMRLASGALTLFVLVRASGRQDLGGNWRSALVLAGYAIPFSFAYVSLQTGTGALILFGFVQATMITRGLASGERVVAPKLVGMLLAVAGLIVLLLPGARAPAPLGAVLMALAGISWGFYSLRGKGSVRPLADTAGNFARATVVSVPFLLAGVAMGALRFSPTGFGLAVLSGAVTSGVGYAIWYAVLPRLTATTAATVQLTAPALAAAMGAMMLGEPLTLRLLGASVLILGGVALVILSAQSVSGGTCRRPC